MPVAFRSWNSCSEAWDLGAVGTSGSQGRSAWLSASATARSLRAPLISTLCKSYLRQSTASVQMLQEQPFPGSKDPGCMLCQGATGRMPIGSIWIHRRCHAACAAQLTLAAV